MTAEEEYRKIKENEYNIFIKTAPRNVEKFANVIGRDYIFDKAFPLFGFKFVAYTTCSIYNVRMKSQNGIMKLFETEYSSYPGRRFPLFVVLYDEYGISHTIPMNAYVENGTHFNVEVLFNSPKNYRVKKISFSGDQSGSRDWRDGIVPIIGWQYDYINKRRVPVKLGEYYWFHEEVWSIKISDIYIYENPVSDSGMRIAGKNGRIYTPAESAFPSPLRIFHKRKRNIMLVPTDTQYASIFKIQTKDRIKAITTLT